MKFKELEKILLKDGWYQVKQKGSHHQYKHPSKSGKVTIPEHGGDLNLDTVKSIMKQAGLNAWFKEVKNIEIDLSCYIQAFFR